MQQRKVLGVMVGAPGVARRKLTELLRSGADGWTAAFFWICLGLAVLTALPVFLITRSLSEEARHGSFVAEAEQAAFRLAHDIDLALTSLRALKGLYEGSVHVSRDEFSAFVRALQPGAAVQSLEWIRRVPATERAEVEEAVRLDGFSEFTFREYDGEGKIVPATGRPEYFPVSYLEPFTGNEAVFGLDLGSSPVSLDALRRARDSGRQAASGRVKLAQDPEGQFGFSVFEPIYAEAALNLDARVERLEGFAHGVFRVADLIRLAVPEDRFQVAVFDLSAPAGERQLYPAGDVERERSRGHEVRLEIADRNWSVLLAPVAGSAPNTLPWIAAATWLGALMVLWTVRELVSSRRHSQELAAINHRLERLSDLRQQAITELERSNRELDDFAYITSHDLKEPLRAVCNHADVLVEDYADRLDDDGRKRLGRLVALSRRMQRLIADLLHFSRLGRGDLAMETVDPNAVIADIEASLTESLQKRNAKVVIAAPLPCVQGHRPHITAVFQNLICNGIKYNDSDEKIIEIGCMPGDAGEGSGGFDRFYVRDNGIGIDEAFKDEVFRIFRRLNSETAYGEGTGAGLSFVKKIVEGHGGSIRLTSKAGEGTTFIFTLGRPAAQGAEAALPRAA
ncbi:MAG: sensor histidine kinase [Geminicoccaceae bacterium]